MVGDPGVDFPSLARWMPQAGWFAIANCKAPGRLGDFKSPGSAVPPEASRREMVGMKGLDFPSLANQFP